MKQNCLSSLNNEQKQALRNSCELLRQRKEMHTSLWNCMQAIEMQGSSRDCMKVHGTQFELVCLFTKNDTCTKNNHCPKRLCNAQ